MSHGIASFTGDLSVALTCQAVAFLSAEQKVAPMICS